MAAHKLDADNLAGEIVKQIDAYLGGSCSASTVAGWAARQLGEHTFSSGEILLDEALCALTALGFEGDTPHEVADIRAALRGERDYTISVRWTPKLEVERARQSR